MNNLNDYTLIEENKILKFRELTSIEDLNKWEKLARSQFSEEDFCDVEYLVRLKKYIKGWCLLDQDDEWIGCCFISSKYHEYNPSGIHFLEICVFPKYLHKGYGKYMLKIMFDNSMNMEKSVCINDNNESSKNLFLNY